MLIKLKHILRIAKKTELQQIAFVLVVIAVIATLVANNKKNEKVATPDSGNKVTLDLNVMSQCPFGIEAENELKGVFEQIGPVVNFNLNYIANVDEKGNFSSLHGNNEVEGDKVQLCAKKYNPSKYFDMILCQNENPSGIPDNWEYCAKRAGISEIDQIKNCYTGDESKTLLKENIAALKGKGITSSPTYFIDGRKYVGVLDQNSVLKVLCSSSVLKNYSACKVI